MSKICKNVEGRKQHALRVSGGAASSGIGLAGVAATPIVSGDSEAWKGKPSNAGTALNSLHCNFWNFENLWNIQKKRKNMMNKGWKNDICGKSAT